MVLSGKKTSPPSLPPTILCREALLQHLKDALIAPIHHHSVARKLILLRAPAGYGKTTLLADFARRTKVPLGWYFLDREDANLLVFLETLTSIFSQAYPEMELALPFSLIEYLATAMQSEDFQQRKQALHTYTTILEQHLIHPFILCLCDYHEVQEGEVLQGFLNHLLQHMPSRLSLVIESRAVPSLELAPLLARRELLGLGSDALRFSAQEIREFSRLQQGFPIPEQEAEQLTKTFDGWIAGILLSTYFEQACVSSPAEHEEFSWKSPAFFADQHTLLAYIKHEIFAKEPQAFTFLQNTSILETLSAPQCNYLLQVEDAEKTLEHIERQGFFVSRVRSQDPSPSLLYVLHPVLRRLLSEDLHHRQPEYARLLHRRAAVSLHTKGDYEQALTHAESAQDYVLTIDILLQAASSEEKRLQEEVIAYWIDRLPTHIRTQHPQILLIRSMIHLTQQEYLQATSLLEQARQLFTTEVPSSTIDMNTAPVLLAEISIAQSQILFQEGKYLQAHQLCLQALSHLSADEIKPRIAALTCLGVCKTLMNEYADGIATLQQALHLSVHTTMAQQTAYIHSCLANSYSLICNYALAEHHRARAIAIYERLDDTQGKINNLIWMAILKRNTGAFHQAETLLQDILSMARQVNFQRGEGYILFNLGAHYIDIDALPQALTAMEESLHVARSIGDKRLTNQCLCELTMVYLLMADNSTAQFLLTQITVPSTEKTSYEALFSELIRGTVLLYQNEVERAFLCLHELEPQVQKMGLKRMYIECLIRLAVCQHKLQQRAEMEASMTKVVQVVTQGYFEHIPLMELRRFPEAWQTVQTFADHACLNAWRTTSTRLEEEEQDVLPLEQWSDNSNRSCKATLCIQAFGESAVQINGAPITHWHMARSMEMCFFLLDYQKPIRKELLVDALWPKDEEYIDQTFRSALHYLRKAIGRTCITSQNGVYTLNLSSLYGDDIWYDAALFRHHYLKAREALESADDERAKASFLVMIELYRGDYLQSFYSDWCILRREELRQWYMEARRELARIVWNNEQFEESMDHWQQILAIDSCSEEAHYGLMRCYARLGKRSLAVRQYQRYAKIIEYELALSPAPALQKLYQRLTQGS